MKSLHIMFRLGLLIGLGIEITDLPTAAQTTQTTSRKDAKPSAPALRILTGEDARRAEEADKAIQDCMNSDRWDEAVARAEELLALRTRAQGPQHFETVNAGWLLKALRRLASQSKEDRSAYKSANSMYEQAEALQNQAKYAQAQPLFEKALETLRRLLGDEQPDTATMYNDIACNLNYQGKTTAAQPLFEKALAIRRRLLTDNNPRTAISYVNLCRTSPTRGCTPRPRRSTRRRLRSTAACSRTTTPSPPEVITTWR